MNPSAHVGGFMRDECAGGRFSAPPPAHTNHGADPLKEGKMKDETKTKTTTKTTADWALRGPGLWGDPPPRPWERKPGDGWGAWTPDPQNGGWKWVL